MRATDPATRGDIELLRLAMKIESAQLRTEMWKHLLCVALAFQVLAVSAAVALVCILR